MSKAKAKESFANVIKHPDWLSGRVCMNGNTILELRLRMTSATQSPNIYIRDSLAEFHNKYYQGRNRQYLCIEHKPLSFSGYPPTFLRPAEDGFQKITLVWTVDTMFRRRWSSSASRGSNSLKEKAKQIQRHH